MALHCIRSVFIWLQTLVRTGRGRYLRCSFVGRVLLVLALGLLGGGLGILAMPGALIQAQPPLATPTQQPSVPALLAPLDSTLFKDLVRARILLLLRLKALTAKQTEHTQLLPLVMAEATATPVATPTPPPTSTPPPPPVPTSPPIVGSPDGIVRTARVPILMYHYLSVPPANADIYRRDLSVAPDRFAQHLDRLQAEGYSTIRLDDLYLHLTQGSPLPERPVLLTFDDGYRDNYDNAFPLLVARGMTATFFIVSDFIDEQRPEYLSWDMVREMYASGMAIEAHGRNHASLAARDDDYLVWQALGVRETIQHELGVAPRFVSYPAGEYDENTIRIFQSAHYLGGVTTVQGASHSSEQLFELRRVRMRGTTDADELMRLLSVDW